MKIHILTIILLSVLLLPAHAQKRKPVRQPEPTPEEKARMAKIERMTGNTAKIMMIDSVVVSKEQFMKAYCLNPETGRIERYQDFFNADVQPHSYVFINALEDRCFFSLENNDSTMNLYSSETAAKKWTRPEKVMGINDDNRFKRVNYPFMMGDGETLYFAAEGAEGLGGYDIYMSTYDEEENRFLRPVNIGMPFNSEANDYMYIIDEYSNVGFFASDRNQPQDSVCIYMFVPSKIRKVYSQDDYSQEQIAAFARIRSIKDTWDDENVRRQALERIQATVNRKQQMSKGWDFSFVINDDVTYHQLSDFCVKGNDNRYRQLMSLISRQDALGNAMDRARDYYETAQPEEREELRKEMIASERKQHMLAQEIHQLEKEIRNSENYYLTKNN